MMRWLKRVWHSYTCPHCGKQALIHECPAFEPWYGGPYY